MPTQARTVEPWENGDRVLGHDETIIGPVRVYGLDAVFDAIGALSAGRRVGSFPDLTIEGLDHADHWLRDWFGAFVKGDRRKRNLVLRDNRGDVWIYLKGTWLSRPTNLVIDSGQLGDHPGWYRVYAP